MVMWSSPARFVDGKFTAAPIPDSQGGQKRISGAAVGGRHRNFRRTFELRDSVLRAGDITSGKSEPVFVAKAPGFNFKDEFAAAVDSARSNGIFSLASRARACAGGCK